MLEVSDSEVQGQMWAGEGVREAMEAGSIVEHNTVQTKR